MTDDAVLFIVLKLHEGKLQVSTEKNVQQNGGENTCTFIPRQRMKFYNSMLEDICKSSNGKHLSYIWEQQSFRWNVHLQLQKLSKSIDFYNSPAIGIRNYREASKDMAKKNDRNVCASLRKRLEDISVRDTEKLDTEQKQRREGS